MEEFKVKYEQPYKEKARPAKTQKLFGFIDRQKYLLLSLLVFVSMLSAKIWSMTIDANVSLKSVTIQAVLFGLLNYLVFFFMSDSGREKGRLSTPYTTAKTNYDVIHKQIRDEMLYPFLQPFCVWKKKNVTEEYRRDCLMDSNISYKEYVEKYQGKSPLSIRKMKLDKETTSCIIEANAYKPPKLQASTLWQKSTFKEQVKFITKSGKRSIFGKRAFKIVIIAAMTILSVSIKTSTEAHFDWSLLLDVLMAASSAFFGYRGGFEAFAYTEALCYETKTEILTEAYDWAVAEQRKEELEKAPQI